QRYGERSVMLSQMRARISGSSSTTRIRGFQGSAWCECAAPEGEADTSNRSSLFVRRRHGRCRATRRAAVADDYAEGPFEQTIGGHAEILKVSPRGGDRAVRPAGGCSGGQAPDEGELVCDLPLVARRCPRVLTRLVLRHRGPQGTERRHGIR